jgi:hypothetical protein
MVVIQDTYKQYFDAAMPGNFAHTSTLDDWISKMTDTAITFGLGVVRGAKDRSVKVPSATGQDFIGIVRRTLARSNADNVEDGASEVDTFHDIITNGYVHVVCEDGCSPGDDVFLRHTVNAALTPGSFRTDGDAIEATDSADQITSATWETTTAAGEIGIVKLKQGV